MYFIISFTLYCCPNLFVRKANGRVAPGTLVRTIHAEYLKIAPKVFRSIWFLHSDWCLETKWRTHAGLHSSLIQLVTEISQAIFYCFLLTAVDQWDFSAFAIKSGFLGIFNRLSGVSHFYVIFTSCFNLLFFLPGF